MPLAYLELIGGLAGDMFLAALLDAGFPREALREVLRKLPGKLSFEVEETHRHGLKALKVKIKSEEKNSLPQTYAPLKALVAGLPFSETIKELAQKILKTLFEAEAWVHGEALEKVHLHELSAFDTLADIFGVLEGLAYLGWPKLFASLPPLGTGAIKASHGVIPLPAPATLKILEGLPVKGVSVEGETVTPTGAALLKVLVDQFGPPPPMLLKKQGFGAGERDFKEIPNILRLWWGQEIKDSLHFEWINELETDLDDQSPEELAYLAEKLREAGALDVTFSPLTMKKGRPGVKLKVLAHPAKTKELVKLIFEESTTLGIRLYETKRLVLPRRIEKVKTPWGEVHIKTALNKFKLEFEDLKRISIKNKIPLWRLRRQIEAYLRQKGFLKN